MKKDFLFAVSTLVGAIVGLGMFGIPYAVERAGFTVGIFYIIGLGIVTLLLHLIYGEIVERTQGKHRLTGYAEKYLGKKMKGAVGAAVMLAVYSSLLAYIIVGGKFLALLFPGISPTVLSLTFWFVLSFVVWKDLRTVGWIEFLMTGFLLFFVVVLFGWGGSRIDVQNFPPFHSADFFLPYGVILFAFSGIFAIPEIREMLKGDGARYKKAIIVGSLVPIIVYLLFTILVVGISGRDTSQDALAGLLGHVSHGAVFLGAILGVLAIATSYIALGLDLKHTLKYDWRLRGNVAGLTATLVPLFLYLLGIQAFITVIAVSGAIFGAVIGLVILLIYRKAKKSGDKKPGFELALPSLLYYGLLCLLSLGAVYEIIYLLR